MQTNPKLAFVFPGQGSQSIGMLADLAAHYPGITQTFAEASTLLGYDLWQLVQQGPEEILNQTEKTQPALLVASIALWRVWQSENGTQPVLMAGHSLGEYSALVCAGSLDFHDTVRLVAARGKYMQAAVPEGVGAMAAIVGLENEILEKLCCEAAQGEVISPANFNSHGQTVVAGNIAAVQRVVDLAKQHGAKIAKLLPVSVPSHCALMRPAAEKFAQDLAAVKIKPSVSTTTVVHNVNPTHKHTSEQDIRVSLKKQLDHPVRWVETINYFVACGITSVVECGSGKVLAGLNKRITTELQTYTLTSPQQVKETLLATQG